MVDGIMTNISVIFFILGLWLMRRYRFKISLFLAQAAILFSGVEWFVQF